MDTTSLEVSPPSGDPVFVMGAAIGAAVTELELIECAAAAGIRPSVAAIASVCARLRAAQEIGLDVQVTTAPVEGQEVLW